ncbi:MAG: sigma-54 dependent transcriptional regulator [Leptospirales bacterium]|nr:sigma-54 dependent transcriptional regulator [Leptospirales bacterium]
MIWRSVLLVLGITLLVLAGWIASALLIMPLALAPLPAAVLAAWLLLPRLEALLFPGRRLSAESLQALNSGMQTSGHAFEDPGLFLEHCLSLLHELFGFEKGFLLITGGYTRSILRSRGPLPGWLVSDGRLSAEARLLTGRLRLPAELEPQFRQIFLLGSATQQGQTSGERYPRFLRSLRALLNRLYGEDFRLFFPVLFQREIFGYLVLGRKRNHLPYFPAELRLLENSRIPFALAIRNAGIRQENQRLRAHLRPPDGAEAPTDAGAGNELQIGDHRLVYSDARMSEAVERAHRVAALDMPVLITGETGVGKELLAALLHSKGVGPGAPFVAVNCASIPTTLWESELFGSVRGAFTDARNDRAGYVEQAGQGALFFDEIGEMPLEIQPKILRLVQERSYQAVGDRRLRRAACRLIFATHRNLPEMIAAGRFREDLYYRINVYELRLPPLRERAGDIPQLAQSLVERYASRWGMKAPRLGEQTLALLCRWRWPGNVRELENCIIRLVADSRGAAEITPHYLPAAMQSEAVVEAPHALNLAAGVQLDFEALTAGYARDLIEKALSASENNRSRAAELLGISRGRLNYQIRQLGLQAAGE